MFSSFSSKNFIVYISITLVVFFSLFLFLSWAYSDYFKSTIEKDLIDTAHYISDYYLDNYDRSPEEFEVAFKMMNNCNYTRAIILNTNREVILMSSSIMVDNFSKESFNTPLINKAFEGETVEVVNKSYDFFNEKVLAVSIPIIKKGELYGIVITATPYKRAEITISKIYQVTFLGFIVVFIFSLLFLYSMSARISKVINIFSNAANKIAHGDFLTRVNISNPDKDIAILADNLNYMASELEKSEDMRNDFIANISHDFRSPLTSIKGFVQAILDGTIPYENQAKYLNIVLEETNRLTHLTNNILLLTKFEHNQIVLEKCHFDMHQVIRKVLLQFEQGIIDKNIDITLLISQKELYVYADLNEIQRVIYNLIDNTIKFCSNEDKLTIETSIVKKKVEISISDTGPGMSEENLKYIWTRFHKLDRSRGQDKKGIGLGLSIVREIIKAHGESIDVYSQLGKGTTFVFTLPLGQESN